MDGNRDVFQACEAQFTRLEQATKTALVKAEQHDGAGVREQLGRIERTTSALRTAVLAFQSECLNSALHQVDGRRIIEKWNEKQQKQDDVITS